MIELWETLTSAVLYFALHMSSSGSFPPPLSADEERETLRKMKNGDEDARKKIIEHNLRLVAHVIKKYGSSGAEQDDLISIGTIGLIKGVNSFDESKGARLATYAARCIDNEILMYFRSQKKSSQDVSLNEPIDTDSEGNSLSLIDILCDDDDIADGIDLKLKIKKLYDYVERMKNEREKTIIIMRYGLYGGEEHTQRDVAKRLGISRSYVSRIEKKIIAGLQKEFRA